MGKEIWSGSYARALPITWQDFDLAAILPAVFYMFRFGHRRGRGRFASVFGPEDGSARDRRRRTTVDSIAERLAAGESFRGFRNDVERAVLGDLLLAFSLENIRRDLGRDQQVQRVAPAHFFASWVDLPEAVAHLRNVPEMIVAVLAGQPREDCVAPTEEGGKLTRFPVAANLADNPLLSAFSQGLRWGGTRADFAGDRFDERTESVGLDQLLMIRLAQELREAPDKLRGKGASAISNQRPIAERAAEWFSEDIRRFVHEFAQSTPRQTFLELLESCMAIGLTTTLTSTLDVLFEWSDGGHVPSKSNQGPTRILVDASNGVDRSLRSLSEQSLDDLMRRVERLPELLMVLRLLDYVVRDNRRIKHEQIPKGPYATAWLDLLGAVLHERDAEAGFIHQRVEDDAERLANEIQGDFQDTADILRDAHGRPNAVRRLAAGLVTLLGPTTRRGDIVNMTDSFLHVDRPHGLARKRRVSRNIAGSGRQTREVRSLVLSDAALTYLVHRHLLPSGSRDGFRNLSLTDFLRKIRERYGFHVDSAPPGLPVSSSLLQRNRNVLERRLRDLGLLAGVNDAEAMKRLRPLFERAERN